MELKREWFIRPTVKGRNQWSPFEEELFLNCWAPLDREATFEDVGAFINDAFAALIEKGGES